MILTYKYRVRVKDRTARKVLARHGSAVNMVWNYCAAFQRDVESRYRAGAAKRRWPSTFDLHKLTAGTSTELGISATSINEVCRFFVTARNMRRGSPRFRSSSGPRRSLGWVPFKIEDRRIEGNSVVYRGHKFRLFGTKRRPIPAATKTGSFNEDACGHWWFNILVEVPDQLPVSEHEIGIDLGLKTLATCSDGRTVPALRHYRAHEKALAVAQRANNRQRVKAIHARIANCRKDQLHKASTDLVRTSRRIVVGNVSPSKLAKTKMAKSVLDSGWSSFRAMLKYKAIMHGVEYIEIDEAFTSQVCSACGTLPASRPKGIADLGIRRWECSDCGAVHDRDVNAAINILIAGRSAAPLAEGSRGRASNGNRIGATHPEQRPVATPPVPGQGGKK